MGITIAFRGKLKSPNSIPLLIDDVEDICKTNGWRYKTFTAEKAEEEPLLDTIPRPFSMDDYDDDYEEGWEKNEVDDYDFVLKCITFQPHEESEMIELLFDTEGVLRSIFSMIVGDTLEKNRWIFVKTQFAGVDTHIKIVNLLVYLRKQYFKKLEIKDEGGYYPKKDEKTLATRMDFIDNAIATMKDVFENGEFTGSPDEILERIQTALSESFKGIDVQIVKIDTDDFPEEMKQMYIDGLEDFDEEYRQSRKREEWDDDDELPF